MNASPLLFSAPMIHALLREIEQPGAGKTQTRRIVKPQPELVDGAWYWKHPRYDNGGGADYFHTIHISPSVLDNMAECAPWQPGDLIYVRETHSLLESSLTGRAPQVWYWADGNPAEGDYTWPRPSIHMHRWASRITLHLTDVRVERVQEISRGDCMEEGCPFPNIANETDPQKWFADLWDSINAKRGYGWDANPWVWALTFKPILANVDAVLAEPGRYGVAA